MNFDQMMDAWKAQDDKPLYGVNRDLLQLVLQNEQADIRRSLRRDQWITYVMGPGLAIFAAAWFWIAVKHGADVLQVLAACLGAGLFVFWVGALWTSRKRQAGRERQFGNSLHEEVRRNLSLVDYQIANGTWQAVLFWSAPVMIGASLIYWLTFQINTDTGFAWWNHVIVVVGIVWTVVFSARASQAEVEQKLEPRRQRLSELLKKLDAGN